MDVQDSTHKGTPGRAYTFAYSPGEALRDHVTSFSVKGPTKAEIAQIPAAHARTLQRYVTSGSNVDRVQWYMLYYYYSKKKAREPVAHYIKLHTVNGKKKVSCVI